MTVTTSNSGDVAVVDTINVFIDDVEVTVPKGTLVIRAAEMIGTEIPRFCDHPLLEPVAACRMCLVTIEGMPKPQPSCAIVATDGMRVHTQHSSEEAKLAQQGVMEFLLVNHPLDCPVCDKGGECPLQNQAMSVGRSESRFEGKKRTFPKPLPVSSEILLDRERCVNCARCTRFSEQIAGDPFLALQERGASQQVGIGPDEPFDSYFSGNTIQICPVGALTSAAYRFRSRPFDLVSVPTTCEHCASGCALRTDYRRGKVMRRLAWEDPTVNEDWNCDKGRFAFTYLSEGRIESPMVREDGELRAASWPEALHVAAQGLLAAGSRSAVLTGGRLTLEDAYAYSKFARVALGTDDIDFRSRPTSAGEAAFLAAAVAGTPMTVSYEAVEKAPVVVLVEFEPEDESPIVFLRLRKAVEARKQRVITVGAQRSNASEKLGAQWIPATTGQVTQVLRSLDASVVDALRAPGSIVFVGERLASSAGGFAAAADLAGQTGAALVWVPRRAGERAALDAGALAGLLPGGRPLSDESARAEVAAAWGVESLPASAGRTADAIFATILADLAKADAEVSPALQALVVAGVDPLDHADATQALGAIANAPFLVSLETHHSDVTALADVVLPVATVAEKTGSFVTWEGRRRGFARVFTDSYAIPDHKVLAMLADAMDKPINTVEASAIRNEIDALGAWTGARPGLEADETAVAAGAGQLTVATWRNLLDLGTMQEGEPHLAGTARPAVAKVSAATAAGLGLSDGDVVSVTSASGSVTLPLVVADVVDGSVWLPTNSEGCVLATDLGVVAGSGVDVRKADVLATGGAA